MNDTSPRLELLAPAGDMEKLKTAVRFGADAVYFGGELFSLRAGAGNFTVPEIAEAMDWLHSNGAKGYMTINIYPHNGDISPLRDYIGKIRHTSFNPGKYDQLSYSVFLGLAGFKKDSLRPRDEHRRDTRHETRAA